MDRVEKHEEVVVFYNDNDFLDDLLNIEDTELKIYLNGPKVSYSKEVGIIKWWKQNGLGFHIFVRMGKCNF